MSKLREPKMLRALYQPYKFLFYFPFVILCTLILAFTSVLLSPLMTQRVMGYTGVIWARLNSFFAYMGVTVRNRENIDKKQSYVIVSNHQSFFDILVLYGWLGIDFKWVLKKELRKIPGLGIYCARNGHVFVDRSNPEAAIASLEKAKKKIVNGTSVLFFPEGSIYGKGSLGKFKKGAYRMALDLDLPILPITISGTEEILPYKTIDIFPGKATLTIHKPIDTSNYNLDNISELVNESIKRIEAGFDR